MPHSGKLRKTRAGDNPLGPELLAAPRTDDQIRLPLDHLVECYDAVFGSTQTCTIGEDIDASRGLDQLRNPANPGNQRIVLFLEEDPWSFR